MLTLTLKQDEAKNERRSLSTTFSINRRKGRMCELGAVLRGNDNTEEKFSTNGNNSYEGSSSNDKNSFKSWLLLSIILYFGIP